MVLKAQLKGVDQTTPSIMSDVLLQLERLPVVVAQSEGGVHLNLDVFKVFEGDADSYQ